MATVSPPWGHDLEESCCTAANTTASGPRPRTRTEMVRTRREKEASYAQKILPRGSTAAGGQAMVPKDWWKLVEGYRENPYDDLARCVWAARRSLILKLPEVGLVGILVLRSTCTKASRPQRQDSSQASDSPSEYCWPTAPA